MTGGQSGPAGNLKMMDNGSRPYTPPEPKLAIKKRKAEFVERIRKLKKAWKWK